MFFGWFRRNKGNQDIVKRSYEALTQAARAPAFYRDMNVPDTVIGRFEMLSVHMALYFRRTGHGAPALRDLAQDIVDAFFEDIDHSIREIGIGDMGVPKRMKKFARMFYGRLNAYSAALDAGDRDELAKALSRNIHPEAYDGTRPVEGMMALARHMLAIDATLRIWPDEELLTGALPDIAPAGLVHS